MWHEWEKKRSLPPLAVIDYRELIQRQQKTGRTDRSQLTWTTEGIVQQAVGR